MCIYVSIMNMERKNYDERRRKRGVKGKNGKSGALVYKAIEKCSVHDRNWPEN